MDHPDHAFRVRAILWLQSKMGLQTSVMPTHRIEDARGRGRLEAYRVCSQRWSDLLFASLCVLGIAAFLAMFAARPDIRAIRSVIAPIEWVGLVGGLALAIAGVVLHRRSRETIVVDLRLSVAHWRPIGREDVERLRRDADGLAAWMVSEIPFTPEAIEAARRSNVECYSFREGRFDRAGGPSANLA